MKGYGEAEWGMLRPGQCSAGQARACPNSTGVGKCWAALR